jgi:BirA family biotin operon repressor/biotin-[acetyl-CoA-carboxylase] ligase
MRVPDLYPQAILHQLHTQTIPRRVLVYNQTGSTMDLAREHLRSASSEELPLLIVANEQTAGRGRLKRPWIAPSGSALLFSLAMRPDWIKPMYAPRLVWLAGVALCEGIHTATGLHAVLKWPNDVMIAYTPPDRPHHQPTPHKVAGILLESGSSTHTLSWAILGCGINISASPPMQDTRYPSTHLTAASQAPVSRLAVLRGVLQRMDVWYTRMLAMPWDVASPPHDPLFVAWRNLLITPGNHVQIETAGGIIAGYAEDVEPSGALRVCCADGVVHWVSSGDVGV